MPSTDQTPREPRQRPHCQRCHRALFSWERVTGLCAVCARQQRQTQSIPADATLYDLPIIRRHISRHICAFCGDPRAPVMYSIKPTRALRPDGSLTPQEPSWFYCEDCLTDLNELQQRAIAVHSSKKPLGDWGQYVIHPVMMATSQGRPVRAYERAGWFIETRDLLRSLGVEMEGVDDAPNAA